MNFKNSVTPLGRGSVTYARAEDGEVTVLIRRDGAICGVKADLAAKSVKELGVVSLAEECLPTEKGRIEKLGELYYDGKKC